MPPKGSATKAIDECLSHFGWPRGDMEEASVRKKGDTWNESQIHADPLTGRTVRRITTAGLWNEKPAYHTNTTFTADGEFFIFATGRDGRSALCRAHAATGEVTQLTEAVDGIGSRQLAHKCSGEFDYGPDGISGIDACLAPASGWAAYWDGPALRAVNVHTLAERTLVEHIGDGWVGGVLSIDASEENVLAPLMPVHPDIFAGKGELRGYIDCFPEGKGMRTRYLLAPLAGGEPRDLLVDEGKGSAHCPHNPVDDDLILTDRDLPPFYWGGGDDWKSPRCWILRASTGELTPLPPRADQKFQVHAAWTWDGSAVVYHGLAKANGKPDWLWYVGVTKPDGSVIREWLLPDAPHYGHVSAAPDRPAIILDGHFSNDALRWLYYDSDEYRIEDICRHDTEWWSLPGQLTHPHPSTDRSGRWIAFNTARGGRSDVWLVTV